jgi:hypothetical protein
MVATWTSVERKPSSSFNISQSQQLCNEGYHQWRSKWYTSVLFHGQIGRSTSHSPALSTLPSQATQNIPQQHPIFIWFWARQVARPSPSTPNLSLPQCLMLTVESPDHAFHTCNVFLITEKSSPPRKQWHTKETRPVNPETD